MRAPTSVRPRCPLIDYVCSVKPRRSAPKRRSGDQLEQAFSDISVDADLFDSLGPAVNSGAGLFLYGAPGNGKSTLARRITQCFGQDIWVPTRVIEDGQLIKLYDAAYHEAVKADDEQHHASGGARPPLDPHPPPHGDRGRRADAWTASKSATIRTATSARLRCS